MVNLLLVAYREGGVIDGFREIARHAAADHGVRATVVRDRQYPLRRWRWAPRPTLVFSPDPLEELRPVRGRLYQGIDYPKHVELETLERDGVPVPRWDLFDEPKDLATSGPTSS